MVRHGFDGADTVVARPHGRRKRWLANLALLLASALFCSVGFEITLRLFPELLGEEAALRVHWLEVAGDTDSEGRDLMLDDPEIGFLYRPGLEGRIARGDLDFRFRLDSKGFRNPEPWPEPVDIVVLGDSMAFGYGADDGADWVSALRRQLPGVAIVNLGLIGSGPMQQERIYERYAARLRPPLVLWCLFGGNDFDDDRAFARWLEQGAGGSYRRFRGQGDRWLDDSLLGLAQRTYLFWFATDLAKTLAQRSRGRTVMLENGERLQLVLPRPAGLEPTDLDRTFGAVERVRARVENDGGRLFVLLMPTKEEVYLPLTGESAASPTAALAQKLAEAKIPALDLGAALRERASRSGPALYFAIDGHPNPTGQAIIAEAVRKWVADRVPYLADSGSKPLGRLH
jgi:lysophospholipase L1-like esterase